jgi:hypothetical protein
MRQVDSSKVLIARCQYRKWQTEAVKKESAVSERPLGQPQYMLLYDNIMLATIRQSY